MSFTVQQHHVLQYSTNVEHVLQQSGMRLAPLCTQGRYTGKAGVMLDLIGQTTAQVGVSAGVHSCGAGR
jgi:hypothetical protein